MIDWEEKVMLSGVITDEQIRRLVESGKPATHDTVLRLVRRIVDASRENYQLPVRVYREDGDRNTFYEMPSITEEDEPVSTRSD